MIFIFKKWRLSNLW